MTNYAEVIGDPIDQSKSPVIHRFWLSCGEMEGDYRRHRVAEGELADYLAERREDPDWRGCNVTMPLKLQAIRLADGATDRAVTAGAANMILPQEGELVAGNSDVGAVMLLLARLHEAGRPMDKLHLFGSGGAARAVLVATSALGHRGVQIHARNKQTAIKLAVEFGLAFEPVGLGDVADGSGIINATPMGMVGHDCLQCDVSTLDPQGWVFDMVSAPARTKLLENAAARGLELVDGIDMLVEQAAASFTLFFGAAPQRERDAELYAILRA